MVNSWSAEGLNFTKYEAFVYVYMNVYESLRLGTDACPTRPRTAAGSRPYRFLKLESRSVHLPQ